MKTVEICIPYSPRPQQQQIHDGLWSHRFGAVVAHRRMGKTVSMVNHLIRAATDNRRKQPPPLYGYIAPFRDQAKRNVWDYFVYFTQPIPGIHLMVSELTIGFPGGAKISLFGADNPHTLRGGYFDGVVFDEYGEMPPNIYSEVVRPRLSDFQGWAAFIGTPRGQNAFQRIVNGDKSTGFAGARRDDGWYFGEFKASQTHIIASDELFAARKDMTEDEYQQEYECSFEAAVKGAIFASELTAARNGGRVVSVPLDPILPVDTDWDLGIGDSTAIWFSQSLRSGEIRVIDYYENSGEGLTHYAQVLKDKGYTYGEHWAPHDIQVKELASGRSRLETAAGLGIRFRVCPSVSLEDGIHAARMLFPRCYFDEKRCGAGLEALQHYRRDYNTRLNEFKAVPVHDWACFHQDTEVLTRYGTCRIIDLPVDGEVLTPCGWKPYQGPKITRRNAPLVAVTLSDGSTVRCTPDHLWLTDNGWTSAEDLPLNMPIQSCSIHSFNISMGDCIDSGQVNDISRVVARNYIAWFGKRPLGQFLRNAIYITGTKTQVTTGQTTWNVYLPATTWTEPTVPKISTGLLRVLELQRQYGIGQQLGGFGIADSLSVQKVGQSGVVSVSRVLIAGVRLICSSVRAVISRNTVHSVARRLRVVSVERLNERADTCCIHVPDVECFTLACGAIVHNSHGADAFRYLAVRQKTPQARKQINWGAPLGPWNG